MTIQRKPSNVAREFVRRVLPKEQPRRRRTKNPGEAKTRKLLAARSGGRCEICGLAPAESVHHRRKRSQGGPWSASNCVHICGDGVRGCHGWVENFPDAAASLGFHLRPGEDAALTRIVSAVHGKVLLSDDGSVHPIGGEA